MIKNKTWFQLTEEEKREAAKLTPKEQEAVELFTSAALRLPKDLLVEVEEKEILISKRITKGSSQVVATVKRKHSFEL